MTRVIRVLLLLALFSSGWLALGQSATGTPPFSSTTGGFDNINLGNLNANIRIPALSKGGLIPFNYTIAYDSSVWYPVTVNGVTSWQYVVNFGWHEDSEPTTGYLSYSSGMTKCWDEPPNWYWGFTYSNYVYHDAWGAKHPFGVHFNTCDTSQPPGPVTATDGSGYTLNTSGANGTITAESGKVFTPPLQAPSGSAWAQDTNGNQITINGGTFTDTLGVTALTIGGNGNQSSPKTFTYTPPSGPNVAVTLNYETKTVQTNFGCTTSPYIVNEFGPTSIDLVTSISLPDGTSYGITYEPTPGPSGNITGRIASITLPTGGTISYAYAGRGSNGLEPGRSRSAVVVMGRCGTSPGRVLSN